MPPLWPTDIIDLKIEPVKTLYDLGESVVLSGRLEVHKLGGVYYPEGRPIEIWSDMVKTEFGGVTDTDGRFEIVVVLPLEPGTYSYRARFPGHDWVAAEDGSWSDPIILSTEIPAPPVISPTPPPPRIPKYLLYASIGLLGVGTLIWLMRR